MKISVRAYEEKDLPEMIRIWNEVVEDGVAFPQEELLSAETGKEFFAGQTYSAVAEDTETGTVYGLYILHPNNVGRCGHICNASYAVDADRRGQHIWYRTVLCRAKPTATACCSSMRLWQAMCMPDICMNDWVLCSLASFRRASA